MIIDKKFFLGEGVRLSPSSTLLASDGGKIYIGDGSVILDGAVLNAGKKIIRIGNGVTVGSGSRIEGGSRILDGVTIGNDAFVASDAVVTKSVPSGASEGLALFKNDDIRFPVNLRKGTSDDAVYGQIFSKREYEIDFGFEPQTIVDCGANIGLSAVFFKNKFPRAKIIAVEPEPSNFAMLKLNTRPYENIVCLNNGIWNRTAPLVIEDLGWDKWGFVVREAQQNEKADIHAISLKNIMETHGLETIDVLKIDIEGSEKELFSSDYDFWLSRTKVLFVELHDHLRKGASHAFFKAMLDYEFAAGGIGENIICFMGKDHRNMQPGLVHGKPA